MKTGYSHSVADAGRELSKNGSILNILCSQNICHPPSLEAGSKNNMKSSGSKTTIGTSTGASPFSLQNLDH